MRPTLGAGEEEAFLLKLITSTLFRRRHVPSERRPTGGRNIRRMRRVNKDWSQSGGRADTEEANVTATLTCRLKRVAEPKIRNNISVVHRRS